MVAIFRLIKADFMKMKRTPFYLIHVCIPIIGVIIFLAYFSGSKSNDVVKLNLYLQALLMAFPILIGIVCSAAVQQEAMAGKFKEMIGTKYGRGKCLLSKTLMLLFAGFISLTLAVGMFYIGFQYLLKQNTLQFSFYIYVTLIIFWCQIFIYLFHLWLSLNFGSGASIGMGIFESLVSALFVTGLGDGIWQWIPCGWGIKICNNLFIREPNSIDAFNKVADMNVGISNSMSGIRNSVIFTILFGVFLLIWFNFYESNGEKQ